MSNRLSPAQWAIVERVIATAPPVTITRTYSCPTNPVMPDGTEHTIIGCGATIAAVPDDEGLIDCPTCGIWFNPDSEN